jgi:hypothetical protein
LHVVGNFSGFHRISTWKEKVKMKDTKQYTKSEAM